MPFAQRVLIALRTLIDDDRQSSRPRRRRPNGGARGNTRSRQTAAIILTFRDLFTSSGLNAILDEIDKNRRPSRRYSRCSFTTSNRSSAANTPRPRVTSMNHIVPISIPIIPDPQEESVPLLFEETETAACTMLVPTNHGPNVSTGLLSSLFLGKKDDDYPVPLDTDDEEKAVKTLRKVLKWSPKKRNSAKFSVPLPREEEHVALAVVQNAVNTVKEEQHKKKKRFMFFKLC